MRQLNNKQKKLIEKFLATGEMQYFNIDNYPELYDELESINDHETMWSNANRYANDVLSAKRFLNNRFK